LDRPADLTVCGAFFCRTSCAMTHGSQRRRRPKTKGLDRARRSKDPGPRGATDRRARALWWAVALTALVLLLTVDDRYPGAIADGRQMAWTAIAITETGEIGQARGRDFTW